MSRAYLQTHCRIATTDLDEAREHVGRLWERHQSRLLRGRTYGLRWHQADLRRISLSYIHSASALHLECGPVGGRFRFTMPEAGIVHHRIDGHLIETTPSRGVLYAPRQELQLEIQPFRSLLLTIDADLVERATCLRFGRMLPSTIWPSALPLDLAPAVTLRSLCRWLGQELDRPATPLLTSRRVGASLERTIVSLFLECLAVDPVLAEGRMEALAEVHLRRVEDWLDDHFREPIGVEDMAQVAGVGVRAVQGLFRRFRSCTPSDAIVQRRLAYARRRLMNADARTTVTDVAFDSGFFHLSRFASRYACSFGERPSETLAGRQRAAGLASLEGIEIPVDASR